MKKQEPIGSLALGEYILPNQGGDNEIAGARWALVTALSRVLPKFFEQLRAQVYPVFSRVVEKRPSYWAPEWTFETWQELSASDPEFTRHLMAWAKSFHAGEEWILDGALRTLWMWHQDQDLRAVPYSDGFRTAWCVDTLSSDEERQFTFRHRDWNPQFERQASFHKSITEQFHASLKAYEERLCFVMESQGAVRARKGHSVDNFEWFALCQLGGMTATEILELRPDLKGDESTILKGVKTAARLLEWKNLRKMGKQPIAPFPLTSRRPNTQHKHRK